MKPTLDFYYKCKALNRLPEDGGLGLCGSQLVKLGDELKLFIPDADESFELVDRGFCPTYWASGLEFDHPEEMFAFTPLRENIVLLIAAMRGEL